MITYRVAYLIAQGVPAESILLVTFTRRAAREMVGRLEALIGPKAAKIWAGTFHHIGNRLLRRSAPVLGFGENFTILDGEDQLDLVKLAMDDAGLVGTGRMAPKPNLVQHLISFAFNVRRPLAEVIQERHPDLDGMAAQPRPPPTSPTARRSSPPTAWTTTTCSASGPPDRGVPRPAQGPGRQFRHLLVDEMQDTNTVQADLVETLAREGAGT